MGSEVYFSEKSIEFHKSLEQIFKCYIVHPTTQLVSRESLSYP